MYFIYYINIRLQHILDLWHRPLADISNNMLLFPLKTGPTEPFISVHCLSLILTVEKSKYHTISDHTCFCMFLVLLKFQLLLLIISYKTKLPCTLMLALFIKKIKCPWLRIMCVLQSASIIILFTVDIWIMLCVIPI